MNLFTCDDFTFELNIWIIFLVLKQSKFYKIKNVFMNEIVLDINIISTLCFCSNYTRKKNTCNFQSTL